MHQVLVLVSGGSDSVALLLALERAAKAFQPPLRVQAAHFNHALRGKDSDADQDFVVDMARGLGVPLHVRRWKGTKVSDWMLTLKRHTACRYQELHRRTRLYEP